MNVNRRITYLLLSVIFVLIILLWFNVRNNRWENSDDIIKCSGQYNIVSDGNKLVSIIRISASKNAGVATIDGSITDHNGDVTSLNINTLFTINKVNSSFAFTSTKVDLHVSNDNIAKGLSDLTLLPNAFIQENAVIIYTINNQGNGDRLFSRDGKPFFYCNGES